MPDDTRIAHDSVGARSVRAALVMGGRGVLLDGVNAVAVLLLARLLVPDAFGVYSALVSIPVLAEAFLSAGVVAYAVRHRDRHVAGATDRATWAWVALIGVIVLAVSVWFSAPLLGIAVALMVAQQPLRIGATIRCARALDFAPIAASQLAEGVIAAVLGVGLVIAGTGLTGLAVALMVATVAATAVLHRLARRHVEVPESARVSRREAHQDTLQTFSEVAASFIWVPMALLVLGEQAAGAVRIALLVAMPLVSLVAYLSAPLYAGLTLIGPDQARLHHQRIYRGCTLAALGYLMLMIPLAPLMIPLLFGTHWEAAVAPSVVVLAGGVGLVVGRLLRLFLQADGVGHGLWVSRAVTVAAGMALMPALAALMPLVGPAVAIAGAQVGWMIWLSVRTTRAEGRWALPYAVMVMSGVLVMLAGGLAEVALGGMPGNVAAVAASALALVGTMLVAGRQARGDARELRSLLSARRGQSAASSAR